MLVWAIVRVERSVATVRSRAFKNISYPPPSNNQCGWFVHWLGLVVISNVVNTQTSTPVRFQDSQGNS